MDSGEERKNVAVLFVLHILSEKEMGSLGWEWERREGGGETMKKVGKKEGIDGDVS